MHNWYISFWSSTPGRLPPVSSDCTSRRLIWVLRSRLLLYVHYRHETITFVHERRRTCASRNYRLCAFHSHATSRFEGRSVLVDWALTTTLLLTNHKFLVRTLLTALKISLFTIDSCDYEMACIVSYSL